MEKLLKFIAEHSTDDVSRLILDRKRYPETDIDLAVNCIESRRKLKGKIPEWHDNPNLIFPLKLSAEQCSSSATGRYKSEVAQRIATGSPDCAPDVSEEGARASWTVADLTGGLGADSWFFSQKASKVIYNEMQNILCEAAKHNFKTLGAENISISNHIAGADTIGDILTEKVDLIYMDPARRGEGGRKVFLIEDCTPDVLTLKDVLFKYARHILIKLSPMADITMVCERLGNTCREIHAVAAGGECKELLVWMDREYDDRPFIHAVELHPDGPASIFTFKTEEESRTTAHIRNIAGEAYLFEPGKAMMKTGAFNLISSRFNISKLGKSTHYYLTDSEETAEELKKYGKVFAIIESCPLEKRSIKEMGKKYPKAEVTARNIPMDTDTLRKKLGITSGDDAHIFGLRSDKNGNMLFICKNIPKSIR